MKRKWWLWMPALVWLCSGCCSQPGVFEEVHDSMVMVQTFYDPLIRQDLAGKAAAQQAVVAADTTLLLAGELQRQWCPDRSAAQQVALQAREARKLAREVGVVEAATSPGPAGVKDGE